MTMILEQNEIKTPGTYTEITMQMLGLISNENKILFVAPQDSSEITLEKLEVLDELEQKYTKRGHVTKMFTAAMKTARKLDVDCLFYPQAKKFTDNQSGIKIHNFDYAVIRYKWKEENGRDLDTRTQIVQPMRSTTVGFARSTRDEGYLTWGSDNTGNGVESILLDMKKLAEDHVQEKVFNVLCSAFWYGNVRNGDVEIEFETYLGGEMQQQGYDFINLNGQQVQHLKVEVNTQQHGGGEHNGQPLAMLTYDITQKSGTLKPISSPEILENKRPIGINI